MTLPSARQTYALIVLFCTGLMLVGFYMEYQMNLEPCPLCMTQRVFICAAGFFALLAFIHYPGQTGQRIYAGLVATMAVVGGGFSSRQLWLQNLPEDKVPACGPSLDYMLEMFPLMDTLKIMLSGDGNCAEVVWTFLGLSIPAWTLVAFLMIVATAVFQGIRTRSTN